MGPCRPMVTTTRIGHRKDVQLKPLWWDRKANKKWRQLCVESSCHSFVERVFASPARKNRDPVWSTERKFGGQQDETVFFFNMHRALGTDRCIFLRFCSLSIRQTATGICTAYASTDNHSK